MKTTPNHPTSRPVNHVPVSVLMLVDAAPLPGTTERRRVPIGKQFLKFDPLSGELSLHLSANCGDDCMIVKDAIEGIHFEFLPLDATSQPAADPFSIPGTEHSILAEYVNNEFGAEYDEYHKIKAALARVQHLDHDTIYTLFEIEKELNLPDTPCLMFDPVNQRSAACPVQTSHLTVDQLLSIPGMAESTWRFSHLTSCEQVPVFFFVVPEGWKNDLFDFEVCHVGDPWWVTPKGYYRPQPSSPP